jgi:hypothetical protein
MKKLILIVLMIFVIGTMMNFAVNKNAIWGAYVKYKSSTEIYLTAGSGRCNGTEWEIAAETTINLYTVLPAGEDFLYIYIDDSASSYPTPTIIGSTTEPAWSDSKIGWYNGDDRCIGTVWCDSNGNIFEFQNNMRQEYFVKAANIKQLISTGNPSSTWQSLEATAYIPINADAVRLYAKNSDSGNAVQVCVGSYENNIDRIENYSGPGTYAIARGWVFLERNASRDLQWYGLNDDDNLFMINIIGYRIER